LDCQLPDELQTVKFDREVLQRSTRECLAKLPGDPRFYTTSVAVRDLDDVRAMLGYRQINLYGISYGTRVVQHYLRRFPQQVRSAVLDGVVPVETVLGPEIAPAAQKSLDAILTRCANQTACNAAFPNVVEDFRSVRKRLAHGPITMTIPDPRTAMPTSLDFGEAHLDVAVRLLSYTSESAALLPFLIHEAANNRPQAMAAQALLVARSIGDQVANGMHNSVVSFMRKEALADPAIANSYLGSVFTEALQASCAVWPQGIIDEDFHSPLHSSVPTLLLSGENDPVTPSSFGEQALKSFVHGEHFVFAGRGHGQFNSPCGMSVIASFVEHASIQLHERECLARVVPMPFMLDANGPAP
jgi:pimeloyl-ACP methyl ester carboxylesterase